MVLVSEALWDGELESEVAIGYRGTESASFPSMYPSILSQEGTGGSQAPQLLTTCEELAGLASVWGF